MTEDGKTTPKRVNWLKRLLPLILLIGAGAIVLGLGWHHHLTLRSIAENRDALQAMIADHKVTALLCYMAVYAGTVGLSLPGGIYLTLLGGFLFGWVIGGAAAVVGATIGAAIIFLIARTSLGEPLAERAGPWLAKLRRGFQEDALSYLLFLRLVPVFPFWLVNLAPALLGVSLGTYLIGTFFGIIPGAFAFAFAGAGLDSVIEAQKRSYQACLEAHPATGQEVCSFELDPAALVTTEVLIGFAALGLLALLPVVVKKLRKSSNSTSTA